MSWKNESLSQDESRRMAEDAAVSGESPGTADPGVGDRLKSELDDLLDEIDEVLEENAEEFVRRYVQKGGE